MQIPSEAKQKWQLLHQYGDAADIAQESGFDRRVISGALDGDECSIEVFTAIQEFYNKRQAAINNLINPQESAQA